MLTLAPGAQTSPLALRLFRQEPALAIVCYPVQIGIQYRLLPFQGGSLHGCDHLSLDGMNLSNTFTINPLVQQFCSIGSKTKIAADSFQDEARTRPAREALAQSW